MSIIHVYLSTSEVRRLSLTDRDYLNHKLKVKCMLNNLLHRPVNRPLLAELRCVLDSRPLARRKTEQYERISKVKVYNAKGKLVRIEHGSGRVMKYIQVEVK